MDLNRKDNCIPELLMMVFCAVQVQTILPQAELIDRPFLFHTKCMQNAVCNQSNIGKNDCYRQPFNPSTVTGYLS